VNTSRGAHDGEQIHRATNTPANTVGRSLDPSIALTQRECEMLFLFAWRPTDAEIAAALSISRRTASNHVANILSTLGVANRREAGTMSGGCWTRARRSPW
jgi:DNA-binding NarL/FixJ family response regulator